MPSTPHTRRASTLTVGASAAVAGGAFIAAAAILALLLFKGKMLVELGLVGNLYYVVLVPLGLSAAAFLFGLLRSYAAYTGKVAGGSLQLGGPVVAFLLVILLGRQIAPNPQPFPLTVLVHGEAGRQDFILRGTGGVVLDLDGNRRREPIGENGQAYFPGIDPSFRAKAIPVALDAPGYELVKPNATLQLEGEQAYIAARASAAQLTGAVRAANGQPVAGAIVSAAGVDSKTNTAGYFQLAVPGAAPRPSLTLQVTAAGYKPWNHDVVPGSNEVGVILFPAH